MITRCVRDVGQASLSRWFSRRERPIMGCPTRMHEQRLCPPHPFGAASREPLRRAVLPTTRTGTAHAGPGARELDRRDSRVGLLLGADFPGGRRIHMGVCASIWLAMCRSQGSGRAGSGHRDRIATRPSHHTGYIDRRQATPTVLIPPFSWTGCHDAFAGTAAKTLSSCLKSAGFTR